MASALLGYHTFSGCDSVSAFTGRGKKRGFELLKNSIEYETLFKSLGQSYEINSSIYSGLTKFVCELYGATGSDNIDDVRYRLFCVSSLNAHELPPCNNALYQHALRANYQCCISRSAIERIIDSPDLNDHGWIQGDEYLAVRWITQDPMPKELIEVDKCGCKTGCGTDRCTCHKASVRCTDLCKCTNCKNSEATPAESEMMGDSDDMPSDVEDDE